MAGNDADETTRLLAAPLRNRRLNSVADVESIVSSNVSKEEQALGETSVGERLPYNDYTTIDWLHDLVKDSYRTRAVHSGEGLRYKLWAAFDSCQGWIAAALIGTLTACVAAAVDLAVATVSDWKTGYCTTNFMASKEMCCTEKAPLALHPFADTGATCGDWHPWSTNYWSSFGIYTGWALLFGILSGAVTMTTKASLPAAAPGQGDKYTLDNKKKHATPNGTGDSAEVQEPQVTGKTMYFAAGSGIPEIKTILSGFVIPHFLDLKVLVVKAVGSTFAVSTGMNLGKEGPFVHISTCVSYLVAVRFPKYRDNGRKMREMLSAGCASGLSVAFGAPIGGVLFAYEEISTYFPRKVLWRAFICSLFAAIVLRVLNPTGTGKLVLFETSYGISYSPEHYIIFVILGIAGGIFGGVFCKVNFLWSRSFRKYNIIKNHPVFEVFLVVLATAALQYPNPLTREPGDIVIKNLLIDCKNVTRHSFVCQNEPYTAGGTGHASLKYIGWLVYGTLVKLLLTIITFGIKVPSGVIIPALDGGAFFGRLVGQLPFLASSISPGIFAMVGAGAFLAGVSRMTISLAVIMFELTGELEFIVPNMIGIMVAKWVADALEKEGVYDLAQTVLGHPFLDLDHAMKLVQRGRSDGENEAFVVAELIPPPRTMSEITVEVPASGYVSRQLLAEKLEQLKRRGLMDAGLVLVFPKSGLLAGYLAESELEFGLGELGAEYPENGLVRLLPPQQARAYNQNNGVSPVNATSTHPSIHFSQSDMDEEQNDSSVMNLDENDNLDLSPFVDKTPLQIAHSSPMEYAVEMFGKLGLRYLIVTQEGTGRVLGVIIKKRLVVWLEGLKGEH